MRLSAFLLVPLLFMILTGCGSETEMRICPVAPDEIAEGLVGYECFSYTTDGTVSAMTVRLWSCIDGEWEELINVRDLSENSDGIVAVRHADGAMELVVSDAMLRRSVKPERVPDLSGMASLSSMTAGECIILPGEPVLLAACLGYEMADAQKAVDFQDFRNSGCDAGYMLEVMFE